MPISLGVVLLELFYRQKFEDMKLADETILVSGLIHHGTVNSNLCIDNQSPSPILPRQSGWRIVWIVVPTMPKL